MNQTKSEPKLESWSVPEAPFVVEYAVSTLNEIRAYVVDGIKRLSRGGVEEGGVLFGARGENLVRILTWRPIACEHASGPAFQLSQNDRIALGQFLQNAKTDKELSGLHPVGWFVSHSRAGVSLTESDLKTYNHFFPWSWQVALVLVPSKQGTANAGFFFRDSQGEIKAEVSFKEFTIAPSAIKPPAVLPAETTPATDSAGHASRLPTTPRQYQPETRKRRPFLDRRLWIWAVPFILALLVGAMLIDRPVRQTSGPSLSFRVADAGGELRLEWDKTSDAVREAVRGTLNIRDGSSEVELPLDAGHVREGHFNYTPKSGDLKLGLTVYPVNGAPIQESARFVGALNAVTEDPAALRRERDDLVHEVGRLREDVRRLTSRNHELEEAFRILQDRVRVEHPQRPSSIPNQ